MKKVSVIIPVYNVEAYLKRCLDSVLGQTYENLQILLIDDGSTDNSGRICEEYIYRSDKIEVIHKSNGGLSDARNCGLDRAEGDYITFIDSDDFIDSDYIAVLVSLIEKYQADISVVGYKSVKTDGVGQTGGGNGQVYEYGPKEALQDLLYQKRLSTSACAKLYCSELFQKIRFPKGELYEDVNTIYKAFLASEKVVYLDCVKYYYYIRRDSIVHSGFNPKKIDYVNHCQEVAGAVKKIYPDLLPAAISRYVWANIHVWVNIDKPGSYPEIYKKVKNNIYKYRAAVLRDKNVNKKNKMIIAVTYLGWRITRGVYCFSKRI